MYSKIKVSGGRMFNEQVRRLSIEELIALSGSIKRQSEELQEEMQVVSETLMARRIERVTRRLNGQHEDQS